MASFSTEDHHPKNGSPYAGPLISIIINCEIRTALATPGYSSSLFGLGRVTLAAGPEQRGKGEQRGGRAVEGAGSPAVTRLPQTGRPCLRAWWDLAAGTPPLGLQCARTRFVAAPLYRPSDSGTRFLRDGTGAPGTGPALAGQ